MSAAMNASRMVRRSRCDRSLDGPSGCVPSCVGGEDSGVVSVVDKCMPRYSHYTGIGSLDFRNGTIVPRSSLLARL
jgi:hypothetical protein